jgi:NADP-dependent 3-hydroxy acid dehydrogenase YdfG
MENESFLKDFKKIIVDMTKDILISFPELAPTMNVHLKNVVTDNDEACESIDFVFKHCMKTYPDKFFDILYQNDTIFTNEKNSADFLPDIDFKLLWKENLTDKTRETIWKYLQLVLFTIVSNKEAFSGESFGNTAKLFEAINEEEFKSKLEETISQMKDVFDMSGNNDTSENSSSSSGKTSGINLEDLPNPEDLHEHVTKMMEGKLGKLAREIAEETAADLNIDMENAESMNDVFKRLFKNPTKLMSLVKNVGSKLDEKLKKGDINETELLKEAGEMMQHMKNMPGMKEMMSKMGMGGGGGKMNMGAMQANLERSMKSASQKDRLRAKLAANQLAKSMQQQQQQQTQSQPQRQTQSADNISTANVEELVFSTGEQVERSQKKPKNKKKKSKN